MQAALWPVSRARMRPSAEMVAAHTTEQPSGSPGSFSAMKPPGVGRTVKAGVVPTPVSRLGVFDCVTVPSAPNLHSQSESSTRQMPSSCASVTGGGPAGWVLASGSSRRASAPRTRPVTAHAATAPCQNLPRRRGG